MSDMSRLSWCLVVVFTHRALTCVTLVASVGQDRPRLGASDRRINVRLSPSLIRGRHHQSAGSSWRGGGTWDEQHLHVLIRLQCAVSHLMCRGGFSASWINNCDSVKTRLFSPLHLHVGFEPSFMTFNQKPPIKAESISPPPQKSKANTHRTFIYVGKLLDSFLSGLNILLLFLFF